MKRNISTIIRFSVALTFVGAGIIGAVIWLLPAIHTLRADIDSDRASIEIIRQQKSNLATLSREIETIRKEQDELELRIWLFTTEDDFFDTISTIASSSHSVITPTIADATPTGAIMTRTGSLTITGTLNASLAAITSLQRQERLLALQKVTLSPGASPDTLITRVTFTSLWQ